MCVCVCGSRLTLRFVLRYNTRAGARIKGRRQGNATITNITFEGITLHAVGGQGIQVGEGYRLLIEHTQQLLPRNSATVMREMLLPC